MEIINFNGKIIYEVAGTQYEVDFDINSDLIKPGLKIETNKKNCEKGFIWNMNITPDKSVKIIDAYFNIKYKFYPEDKIFVNGYQSWTDSKEFTIKDKLRPPSRLLSPFLKKYKFEQYGDYNFVEYGKRKGELHGFTYSYIRNEKDNFNLIASLNEYFGYTIFKFNTRKNLITIYKDVKDLTITQSYNLFNLIFINGKEDEVFDIYFKNMNIKPPVVNICTGWTSWYNYYEKITEEIILENLNNYYEKKIPIDVFQIDDGYQNAVGDWLITNSKFPKGMKYLANEIKSKGYKAGLWLAPFVCEKKSILYKEHPDWILRDKNGNEVYGGTNWSSFVALDIEKIEVRDYIKKVFDTILNDWGYDIVKLDFLYAVCIEPRENKSRGQIMCEAMDFLRKIIGNRMILGCGVPLGPAFGKVDYCRIGCDIDLQWDDPVYSKIMHRERVSTLNSLTNSIGRRHLTNRAFLNDPDVFLLRHTNIKLTEAQKNTLFLLNLLFGELVFTSDNLKEYSQDEYEKYLSSFPFKRKKIVYKKENKGLYNVKFEIGDLKYELFSNFTNTTKRYKLEKGIYFYYDFKNYDWIKEGTYTLKPYSTVCFLKLNEEKDFEIAGSTINAFYGSEIDKIEMNNNNILIEFNRNTLKSGSLFIRIPKNLEKIKINNVEYKAFNKNGLNLVEYKK